MKSAIFAAVIGLVFSTSAFASDGVTANGLSKILRATTVAKLLANRSISGINIEPKAGMGNSAFTITISVQGASLGLREDGSVGPVEVPCYIVVNAYRPEYSNAQVFSLAADEVCAMSGLENLAQ